MSPARPGVTAAAATGVMVLAVAALLALTTWAAVSGPEPVFRSPGPPARSGPIQPHRALSASGTAGEQQRRAEERTPPPAAPAWARELAVVLEVLAAAGALFLLWRLAERLLLRWRERTRPAERAHEDVDLGVLDAAPTVIAALDADAAEQEESLDHGAPRNAIVARWHRFETTVETVGVRRQRWQTPSEFVLEVLEVAGADPAAVTRLADLYREARFSDHALTEQHRGRAAAALREIHTSLRTSVARPTVRPTAGAS